MYNIIVNKNMAVERIRNWQSWCTRSGASGDEVFVVKKELGLATCVCSRSGNCQDEDKTVQTALPKKIVRPTQQQK